MLDALQSVFTERQKIFLQNASFFFEPAFLFFPHSKRKPHDTAPIPRKGPFLFVCFLPGRSLHVLPPLFLFGSPNSLLRFDKRAPFALRLSARGSWPCSPSPYNYLTIYKCASRLERKPRRPIYTPIPHPLPKRQPISSSPHSPPPPAPPRRRAPPRGGC
jgi:hypothetical protein